jgi:protease I
MANVVVLVEDMYEELELWYPYHRMREAGLEVALVGPEIRTYQGRYGYPAEAKVTPEAVDPANLVALVIPGGYSPDRMRRNAPMVSLVRDVHMRGGVIGAICHAGWLLIEADIVKGHRLTGFHSISRDLVNAGGTYVDAPVVIDGNLITSRSPDDLPSFGSALAAAATQVTAPVP